MTQTIILFCVVAATHLAYGPLSSIVGTPQDWFYILRGMEGAVAFWLLRRASTHLLWLAICMWAVFEESLTAVCGVGEMLNPTEHAALEICGPGMLYTLISVGIALALAAMLQERMSDPARR